MQPVLALSCVAFLFTVVILEDSLTNAAGITINCAGPLYLNTDNGIGSPNPTSETAYAPLGCPCALVGQKCLPDNSQCLNTGITTFPAAAIGNVGNGNPKLGTCSCQQNWFANYTTGYCYSSAALAASGGVAVTSPVVTSTGCALTVTGSPVTISNCVAAFSAIPGITIAQTGCVKPLTFLIAADTSATGISNGDAAPYVNIDPNTLEVYALPILPTSTSSLQAYNVVAIDATGKISNQVGFAAIVSPLGTGCTVCGP